MSDTNLPHGSNRSTEPDRLGGSDIDEKYITGSDEYIISLLEIYLAYGVSPIVTRREFLAQRVSISKKPSLAKPAVRDGAEGEFNLRFVSASAFWLLYRRGAATGHSQEREKNNHLAREGE